MPLLRADDEVIVSHVDKDYQTYRGSVLFSGYIGDELVDLVIREERGGYEHFDMKDYEVRLASDWKQNLTRKSG